MSNPGASARRTTYGEAFMLMWYACDCGHRERIWNSRDGITPFALMCPSCAGEMGTLSHVEWRRDQYAPNHELHPGQRFFRDGTPDEAEAIMRKRLDMARDEFPLPPAEEAKLIEQCRDGSVHEFGPGWPMLARAEEGA